MPHSRHHLKMDNLSFIGMAGCGKSTLGLALAKKLDLSFIDTDNLIEKKFEMSLEGVKNKFGYQFVRLAEEEVILSIDKSTKMISTGGSAVYSETSMNHLKSFSKIIYIDTPLETIIERIDVGQERGLAVPDGTSVSDVYYERIPLYEKYSQHTINGSKSVDELIEIVLNLHNK